MELQLIQQNNKDRHQYCILVLANTVETVTAVHGKNATLIQVKVKDPLSLFNILKALSDFIKKEKETNAIYMQKNCIIKFNHRPSFVFMCK